MNNTGPQKIEYYKVGGAVRDALLGIEVKDTDWLVVGATPEWMVGLGFKPVGQQFPVFLHSQTHEEYALARTERKAGRGYHGFEFYASPDVTLEDDLIRRDLTINAMAMDADGTIIDPYNGQQDLNNRCLRHVSEAFAEDPLRVLRVARFYAQFANLGFEIDKATMSLMQQLVDANELSYLSPERICTETYKSLNTEQPWRYFQALQQCGALHSIDSILGDHAEDIIQLLQLAPCHIDAHARYAMILTWCFRLDPKALKPFCQRHKLPNQVLDITQKAIKALPYYSQLNDSQLIKASTSSVDSASQAEHLYKFIFAIGGWRNSGSSEQNDKIKLQQIICICAVVNDYQQQVNNQPIASIQDDWIVKSIALTAKIDSKPLIEQGLKGADIAKAIDEQRMKRLQQYLQSTSLNNFTR